MSNTPKHKRIWVSETDLGERWWHDLEYGTSTEYVREDINAELLEALEMAVLWLEYDGKYDTLGFKAAIAKAKGGKP